MNNEGWGNGLSPFLQPQTWAPRCATAVAGARCCVRVVKHQADMVALGDRVWAADRSAAGPGEAGSHAGGTALPSVSPSAQASGL